MYNLGNLGTLKDHVPSLVQPDTLFNFVHKREYIIDSLKNMRIAPRYCVEDIRYLKLPIKRIAIPMTCFCDINLHKLDYHMQFYGSYSLAFNKGWCMKKGIQSIQYLNRDSYIQKEYRLAFKTAYKELNKDKKTAQKVLEDYLFMQLMYYKPYQGKCLILDKDGNRSTTYKRKSFADECEWRYVPDLTETEFNQIIIDEHIMDNFLNDFNKVFTKEKSVSLSFKYSDLKYVLVKNKKDAEQLIHSINDWKENKLIDIDDVYNILPKIIIWDDIKGDL